MSSDPPRPPAPFATLEASQRDDPAGASVLSRAAIRFAAELDEEAAVAALGDFLVPDLADYVMIHLFDASGAFVQAANRHVDPAKRYLLDEAARAYRLDQQNRYGIVAKVIRTGASALVAHASEALAQGALRDPETRRINDALAPDSYIIVPIKSRDEVIGTISAAFAASERHYDERDLATVEVLAALAGQIISRARLLPPRGAGSRPSLADTLFASAADAILIADEAGRYLDANPAAERLLGYTRAELQALRVPDIVARDQEWTEAEYAHFVETGAWRGELEVRRKDGTRMTIEAAANIARSSDGDLFVSTLRDVTERRDLERQLRLNNVRFRQALANSPIVVFEQDLDLHYTWIANTPFQEADVLGKTDDDLLPAADASVLTARKREVLATGLPTRQEVQTTIAGKAYVYDLTLEPIMDEGSEISGVIGAAVDVTDRRRAEDELLRQAFLLDQAYDAIFAWEWNGPIVYWNRGAERLYGFTKAEAVGRLSHELLRTMHPLGQPEFLEKLTHDGVWEGVVEHLARNGRRLTVETRHQLLREHGRGLVLEADRDLSDRQRAEEERAAFLDAVAHDVRNPLGAIIGRAQLLGRRAARGETDAERIAAGLAEIVTSAERASGMLGELVDAARIRLGQPLQLALAPADLAALAAQSVATHQGTSERHTLRLDAPQSLRGIWDAARIGRAIDNLLSNAIKYSPDGGLVTVTVEPVTDETGEWAAVTVRDEGVGIPAADVAHVFDRFRRGGNVAGAIAGAGIGLSAARQIVAQHGGTIAVESTEGAGSTFTIRLPLESAAEFNTP